MNCGNCGAPLNIVIGQEYTRCEYCGTFAFLEDPVPIETLEDEPAGHHCPLCHVPLVRAQIARWRMWYCTTCRGQLIERGDFRTLVEYKRARAWGPPDPIQPLDRSLLQREVRCPVCDRKMETHPYYGPGQFVIDSCHHCHVVWLDYGELRKAINGPGRDRRRDGALAQWIESVVRGQEKEDDD
ncbi:MAG: zf-TFIIB domain-containing protein [Chloroflexi bacterium]|nr:zf-TFIIB domain-containing protein [Chloroflexota bacterium]